MVSQIDDFIGGSGTDTFTGPGDMPRRLEHHRPPTPERSPSIAFSGFENLTGGAVASNTFTFELGGSLTGTLAGGATSVDSFSVVENATSTIVADPGAGQFNAAGTVTLAGRTIHYTGMDHVDLVSGDAADRVINGTSFGEKIFIEDADPALARHDAGALRRRRLLRHLAPGRPPAASRSSTRRPR